ncbi:hypothetical protein FHW71_004426 [Enterobacter sp. Sphag1F]|nr:hypothetical protein [Enterobacter sp. Sphag1F]NYI16642.1 hypothetical protein [Enterobacter sp. Sphag71]
MSGENIAKKFKKRKRLPDGSLELQTICRRISALLYPFEA